MTVLVGKVALVIGGTRGIGAAISRRMVADGASLAIIGVRLPWLALGKQSVHWSP
jgi:NAD(P)-dependent dehydrogenase (short-subunit alcohol dehydrogenase family)